MPVNQKTLFEKRATPQGTFWVSPREDRSARQTLRGYLRQLDLRSFKQASIGGEQEQGFEQAFSSLAYAYLKDKAPRLIDFIVGFQLVDRNEDNTKAVGIFGFKVGDQWLYAPVFFLNGDLKGHELLYIKKQDAFVPMKENWVNYLISRKPHVLGEGSPQNTQELGGLMPNVSGMVNRRYSKYGSDLFFDEWVKPALPLVFALGTKQARALYPGVKAAELDFAAITASPHRAALAVTAANLDLRNVLTKAPYLKAAFARCAQLYPTVKRGFDLFYGPNFFAEIDALAKQSADCLVTKCAESFIVPPKRRKKDLLLIDDDVKPLKKKAELTVVALDVDNDVPITVNKDELTDEEREKLLRDTVLIKDERDDGRTSIAYNTQVRLELLNPSETGLYEVLEKPGQFDQMVVISNPQSGRGRENFCLVIRKSSPRNWENLHRTGLWVKCCDCPTKADWTKYVEGLDGVESLKKGGTYVAVHENGSGTCAFEIRESYGEGVYDVRWRDYASWNDHSLGNKAERFPCDFEVGYDSWKARVYINKRKGTGLKSINGELSIPDSYKIVKIADPPKPDDKDSIIPCCVEETGDGSDKRPITPGNLVDIQVMFTKQANVRIHDANGNITIRSPHGVQRLSKKAALITLVRDHGLREHQVRVMLKEAAAQQVHNRAVAYLVKYADGYGMLQPGPDAPAFPEPNYGTEPMGYNSVNAIYPQEEQLPVEGLQASMTDPAIYDPFYMPDQNAMQVAQQATASGQKEVFDTAMISGMLKAVRQDSLVDRYLGDLMKALDKLGRILFMFYWHQEEFEDRYGQNDLPELEDSLRNAFEVLGDVCLFLKEKTVQGSSGIDIGSGVGNQSEPDVTEAARN